MKIISIVVTYNATKWIDKCFGSLVNSSLPMEIFVVDNNSKDHTVELIEKNYPQVIVHESTENLGFGKANNLGFKMALEKSFDYVFLLNQDAWVEEKTVENLINSHSKNSEYGIIVPLQMNGTGNLIDSQFMTYTISNNRKLVTDVFNGNNFGLHQVDFANAACWLMPLSTLKTIGGFDPIYPHYGEDDDYVNRLSLHKLKIGLCLEYKVFHDRDDRNYRKFGKALTNELYIRQLIELKNPKNKTRSKLFYYKKLLKVLFLFVFSPNKSFYNSQLKSFYKLLKNYHLIVSHKSIEKKLKPHYLQQYVS